MTAQISITPMATTNAANLFNVNSAGYTQGDAQDDPAVKFALSGGVLSSAATAPLWGGLPIQELIPSAASQPGTDTLGSTVLVATASAVPTGISVYNQAFGGITTPQSPAPLFSPGMSVNFYRFGSGARIPLPIDPALVSLDGNSIVETVYWDYSANRIVGTNPGTQAALPVKILKIATSGNKTVSYNSGTGNATWVDAAVALCLI